MKVWMVQVHRAPTLVNWPKDIYNFFLVRSFGVSPILFGLILPIGCVANMCDVPVDQVFFLWKMCVWCGLYRITYFHKLNGSIELLFYDFFSSGSFDNNANKQ